MIPKFKIGDTVCFRPFIVGPNRMCYYAGVVIGVSNDNELLYATEYTIRSDTAPRTQPDMRYVRLEFEVCSEAEAVAKMLRNRFET